MKLLKHLTLIFAVCILANIFFPKPVSAALCEGAVSGCYSNNECKSLNCQGTCVGYSTRKIGEDCRQISCPSSRCKYPNACTCYYEYCPLTCSIEPCTPIYCEVPGRCYYDKSCFTNPVCLLWSGWSQCSSTNWQYKTCIDGPYQIEWQQCDIPPGGTPRPTSTPTPSCTVSMPASRSVPVGERIALRAVPSSNPWIVERVNFISTGTAISSPSPATDTTSTYDTSISGLSVGSGTVTARVIINGVFRCEDTSSINVTLPGPWWQVKDSDIFSQGDIGSFIPSSCTTPGCQSSFDLDGIGGYPGIPIYSGLLNLGSWGTTSSKGWNAKTDTSLKRNYSLSYFERQIPQDTEVIQIPSSVVEGNYFTELPTNNTYWYKFDSSQGTSLTINSDVHIGSRKIVIILDGVDLYINGRLNLSDGLGMFLILAGKGIGGNRGNIYINPSLGGNIDTTFDIEGLYFTENQIFTGAGSIPLQIRGSLAALDGINLERNLTDNSQTPSELIEYAPDQIMLMPLVIKNPSITWKEIAP